MRREELEEKLRRITVQGVDRAVFIYKLLIEHGNNRMQHMRSALRWAWSLDPDDGEESGPIVGPDGVVARGPESSADGEGYATKKFIVEASCFVPALIRSAEKQLEWWEDLSERIYKRIGGKKYLHQQGNGTHVKILEVASQALIVSAKVYAEQMFYAGIEIPEQHNLQETY